MKYINVFVFLNTDNCMYVANIKKEEASVNNEVFGLGGTAPKFKVSVLHP